MVREVEARNPVVAGEAQAVARLVRGYLSATAVVVALVTTLTLLTPGATQMSRTALLIGAACLLTLQVTGARLDWERRLLHGRGQLTIDLLVLGLTLVNSIQPMVSGPDEVTAWGIAVTVVFTGLVASRTGVAVVMATVVVTSAFSIVRFADQIEAVAALTSAIVILVLGALAAFAGRSFRTSLRDRQAAEDALVLRTEEARAAQQQTIEQLRHLDELKDDFISTASHELRTPLTVILGLSSTLRRPDVPFASDESEQLLDRLQSKAQELHEIVTRVLDFDHIGEQAAGALDRSCDVALAVTLALGLVETDDHHVNTTVGELPPVVGTEVLVSRVIAELVANAVRHTPAGTRIKLDGVLDGDVVRVTVSDDGPGIPPDEFEGLVQRFRRGGRYETRSTRGLGLGLSFCAGVLTRLGSELHLEPVASGTRLSFELPLARNAAPEARVTHGSVTAESSPER